MKKAEVIKKREYGKCILIILTLFTGILFLCQNMLKADGESIIEDACKKNLQFLFQAIEMYRADNNGYYPPSASGSQLWPDLIKKYIKGENPDKKYLNPNEPFFCPSISSENRDKMNSSPYVSYGYNGIALGGGVGKYKPGEKHHKRGTFHLVNKVDHPSKTILLVEADAKNKPYQGYYLAYPGLVDGRHNGKAYALFCDGHIELLPAEELNTGAADNNNAPWFGHLSTKQSQHEDAQSIKDEKKSLPLPIVSVSRAQKSPVIDGNVTYEEWGQMTSFYGFKDYRGKGKISASGITTFMCYESNSINFLFIIPLDDKDKLKANVTKSDDGSIWRDDSIEIHIQPEGQNSLYHFICNSANAKFDAKDENIAWNSSWKTASAVTTLPKWLGNTCLKEKQKAWMMEVSIPIKDFGVNAITNQKAWRINLCKNSNSNEVFSNTFDSYSEKELFAYFMFQNENIPILQMSNVNVVDGVFKLSGKIINHSTASQNIKIKTVLRALSIEIEDEETKRLAKGVTKTNEVIQEIDETCVVPTGETKYFEINKKLTSNLLNQMDISITWNSDQPLYKNSFSFVNNKTFSIIAENYPSYKKLISVINTEKDKVKDEFKVLLTIKNKTGTELFKKTVPICEAKQTEEINYETLEEGDYVLTAVFSDSEGKLKSIQNEKFSVINPEWLNGLNIPEIVLPPWTPVKYKQNNTVNVWGREIIWGKSLFPEKIFSQGKNILTAPITATLSVNGKAYKIIPETFTFIKQSNTRGEMRMTGSVSPKIQFTVDAWIEYDGFIWYEIKFKTASKINVDSFCLEIPVSDAAAKYYSTDRFNELINIGLTGFEFSPIFILSNIDRGLCFVSEAMENWNIRYGKNAYYLNRVDNGTILTVSMINKTAVWEGEKNYAFGIQPLPVKPLPSDWHSWKLATVREGEKSFVVKYAGNLDGALITPHGCNWNSLEKQYMLSKTGISICNPMEVNGNLNYWVQKCHKNGNTPAIPYFLLGYIDNEPAITIKEDTIKQAFRFEWIQLPYAVGPWSPSGTPKVCLKSSYRNYMLYAMKKIIENYHVDGIYFDCCGYGGDCLNHEHGCGYYEEEELKPTKSILASRDFLKKIATLLYLSSQKNQVMPSCAKFRQPWPNYILWGHASATVCPPIHSFLSLYYTGEQYQKINNTNETYANLLELKKFQAEFLPTTTGILTYFLPFKGKNGNKDTYTILSYLLTHGIPFFSDYIDQALVQKVYNVQIAFETRDAEFVPCWEPERSPIKIFDKKDYILSSARKKKDDFLVVISNIGNNSENLRIGVKNIGDNAKPKILDCINNENLEVKNGEIVFSLEGCTFKILRLSMSKSQ